MDKAIASLHSNTLSIEGICKKAALEKQIKEILTCLEILVKPGKC